MDFFAFQIPGWRIRKWRVQTIKMPVFATIVTLNHCARTLRRLSAGIAQQCIAFAVLGLREVGDLIIARAIPAKDVSARAKIGHLQAIAYLVLVLTASMKEPFLSLATPSKQSLMSCGSAKFDGLRFLRLLKSAANKPRCGFSRRICCERSLCNTDVAVPWFVQLTRIFTQRRIEAREVKGPVAAIAT